MIKLDKKTTDRPSILHARGPNKGKDKLVTATQGLKDFFDANKDDIISGKTKFNFDSDLYAHKSIKEKLKEIQHDKCCFCEAKLTHISHGDIEHFRPKAAFCQDEGDDLVFPGYFWLAYEWDNLFFSCQLCNQRFKKNLFPLLDHSKRVSAYNGDISQETAFFLDPAKDTPEDHIIFINEVPRALPGSSRGEVTIKALGLNRTKLNEDRRKHLDIIINMLYIMKCFPEIPEMKLHHDKAKDYLKKNMIELMKATSEYSLMFICFYQQQLKSILQ